MKPATPLKILIVDDENVVRETLSAMLKHFGHATELASDGLSGKEIMTKNDYDAAFVDIRMPGIDGITLLKWSREREKSPQIIIMTGHGEAEAREEAMRHGAFAFLNKPFRLDQINQLINQVRDLIGVY
jgi:DNA-binding NtrC family response regulator